ncbi:putative nuclease HARBI1 [Odontesthes bonariensis]
MSRHRFTKPGLASIFISFPGHRRLCDIKEEFYRIAGFPNVIGAVDCTHIKIKSPSGGHEGDFVNRKNFHSINVQMVCNADYLISNVVAKWPGSVHDSRVFRNSDLSAPITRCIAGSQRVCLPAFSAHSICRPSGGTTGIQPCPCQNKGPDRNDIWPTEGTLSVSEPPESQPRQGM